MSRLMRAFKGWRRFPCADRACAIPIHPGILGFRVKKEARQWLGASPLPLTEYDFFVLNMDNRT